MKMPCPAPTNTEGTCVFCGKKFSPANTWANRVYIPLDQATPKQLEKWPLIHWYERHPDGLVYLKTTYDNGARGYRADARCGLADYNGSWRRKTAQGDDLFCNKVCAVQFARIAANMGFRLPTHTPEERKIARQHHEFLQEFAPLELEPPERADAHGTETATVKSRAQTYTVNEWSNLDKFTEYKGPRQPPKSKRFLNK